MQTHLAAVLTASKALSITIMATAILGPCRLLGDDQPQWGERHSRNMVSLEKKLPESFDPATGRNIKWRARLGTESHSTPIIANGRVYIGTNNGEPRDARLPGDMGILMCFDEKDGHFLWQLAVPKREEDPYFDWPKTGMSSSVTVEGNRVYVVSNRGEVMCLDAAGMANGNDGPFRDEAAHMSTTNSAVTGTIATDADIIWMTDLPSQAGIWSHDGAHSAILIDGDFLYLNSGTGVDNTHRKIRTPDAPSLIVLDKRDGRILARDEEQIAPNVFHCTWSGPSLGEVGGRRLIFFAGGNGIVYAFDALKSKPLAGTVQKLTKVWQFDFDPAAPKTEVHRFTTNRREGPSNIYGMPVFVNGRIYVAGGGDLWWGKNEAWLKCIDVSKPAGVTQESEVWKCPLEKHVLSTAAVFGDLVFMADAGRNVHCVDLRTGEPYWKQETGGDFWASPMVADGKVYIGTRRGDFWIFAASKEKKVLSTIDLKSPISGTVTPANGVLFLATMKELLAIAEK